MRKKLKNVKEIRVELFNEDKGSGYDFTVYIPEDGSLEISTYGTYIMIYDKNNLLIKRYYVQAGYTWKMDYIYYNN